MRNALVESLIWIAFFLPPAAAATGSLRGSRSLAPLDPGLAGELRARRDPHLDSLRAGKVREVDGPTVEGREALRAAELAIPELSGIRAGFGAETVLVAALVVLLIVLIV